MEMTEFYHAVLPNNEEFLSSTAQHMTHKSQLYVMCETKPNDYKFITVAHNQP
jgi:hypothetical protein